MSEINLMKNTEQGFDKINSNLELISNKFQQPSISNTSDKFYLISQDMQL